ncbi:hypothetical protein PENFLA_c011G10507 [Penicillium flavigenum]|uniref:Uncharacterized protein n=1 Tax=Penicillium flavigenum TaxID=254877 RepID=A0A1V6TAV4_9EURO|nr:hypothetical protein PENFLA_c011G10507 [Penicillium flavigenum]
MSAIGELQFGIFQTQRPEHTTVQKDYAEGSSVQ